MTPRTVRLKILSRTERIVARIAVDAGRHEGQPLPSESFPGRHGCVALESGERAGLEISDVLECRGAGREDG